MTAKRITIVEDYLMEYDGDYFDLHKPSDFRSLLTIIRYINDENEQLKKENVELKQKNRGWRRYCESQITHIEFMEKVLENMGYSVVFDNEKQKWVIE